MELYFADALGFAAPSQYTLQYKSGDTWKDVSREQQTPHALLAGGTNAIHFALLHTSALRVLFGPPTDLTQRFRLIELEAFH